MTSSSEPARLRVEQRGRVARLVLCRPERRNPLGSATVEALTAALRAADRDPAVGAVLLTGMEGIFSAGADLKEFQASLTAGATEHWESGELWFELFSLVPALSKPVVAAVNGPAIAGGCGLVALCDLAIASERATFSTPEVNIGLFPLFILPALIRAVGHRQALDLALTGRSIDADEAQRLGLVQRVVPEAELEVAAEALAADLAGKPPATMRLGKHVFQRIAELDYSTGLDFARAIRGTFLASDELRKGTESFFTRRGQQGDRR